MTNSESYQFVVLELPRGASHNMRVLVTGGLGVNGSWVLRELVSLGTRPVCLDYSDDTGLVSDLSGKIEFVRGDVTDIDRVKATIRKYEVDSIIHMAALVSPKVTSLDPAKADPMKGFEVNAGGTISMLEAARVRDVKKFVFTSSKGVYGKIVGKYGHPRYTPITEDHPKSPLTVYDSTKLYCENLGALYSRLYGINFVALRFAHIFGPGKLERHGPLAIHDRIISNALKGAPTRIRSGGDTKDDLIYVRDVAKAHLLALKAEKPTHTAYHFGTGKATSLIDFSKVVKELVPHSVIQIGHGLGYYGKLSAGTQCALDCSLAKRELGFAPEYDLREGIGDYVDWTRRNQVAG